MTLRKQSILVVDDEPQITRVLRTGLTSRGYDVRTAADGESALETLGDWEPDLVVTDLSMPGMNGLELVRRISAEFGRLPVLVLSMHAEEQYALRAFKAGANGYMTKDGASAELIKALRKIASGGAYVSGELAERVVLQLNGGVDVARHAQLSDRELEVLRRLVAGQRPTDIAQALHLSVKTISTHKSRIQEKLELPTLADLVRYGLEHDLDAGAVP